jgi:hypothetical protein
MTTSSIVLIVLIAVVAILLIATIAWVARNKRNQHRHVEADKIRDRAKEETLQVKQREALADETAAKARAAQAEADVKAARDIAGPYLLDKREKLLEGVVLGGVVWGGVQPLAYDSTPLISSGNLILLARLSGTRTIGYLFNIDLSRSNLAESPDWPILITNLVELRRDALPGLARWNYRLGEDVRFRLFEGEGEASAAEGALTLELDGKKKKSVAKTGFVELSALDLDETGVYEVKDGENSVGRFAVNLFDAEESDLRNLVPGRRDAKAKTTTGSIALDNPYSWLILAALLLILVAVFADWLVLKQR